MPLIEYFLLALMAPGAAATGAAPGTRGATLPIMGADAIVQPNGGALSSSYLGQDTPKKEGTRRSRTHRRSGRRHPFKYSRRVQKQPRTPKKDGGA
jgi:hypothetical protein